MDNEKVADKGDAAKDEAKAEYASGQDWFSFNVNASSWSFDWLKSAKEKTFSTLELVKKDLGEFSDAVTSEASAIASNTVTSMKNQAQSIQQIVTPVFSEEGNESTAEKDSHEEESPPATEPTSGGLSFGWKLPQISEIANNAWMKTLVETVKSIAQEETTTDEDENTEVVLPRSSSESKTLKKRLLYAIQTDPKTFLNPPEGDEQLFLIWQKDFDMDARDHEINNLLSNCPSMRELYQSLVPSEVSNSEFWERYFYKVYQAVMMERCRDIALDESFSSALSREEKKCDSENDANSRDADQHSNNDETWSFCSSTEMELQELHEFKEEGNVTPRAEDSPQVGRAEGAKGGDGWVDWEE